METAITPKEKFKGTCAFERVNGPFIWNIDSWYESFKRWVREGMPVKNLDNKKEVNMYLIQGKRLMENTGNTGIFR